MFWVVSGLVSLLGGITIRFAVDSNVNYWIVRDI